MKINRFQRIVIIVALCLIVAMCLFPPWYSPSSKNRLTSANESDYLQILNHSDFKKKRSTVHFLKQNPAPIDRFAACNAVFKNALGDVRCFIDPRCKHLVVDIKNRGYKKGTIESDDKGDGGHASDAMGYPIHILYPILEIKGSGKIIIRNPSKVDTKNQVKGSNGRIVKATSVPIARRGNARTGRR